MKDYLCMAEKWKNDMEGLIKDVLDKCHYKLGYRRDPHPCRRNDPSTN